MEKISSQGIPCTYCSRDAIPNTNPPVCEQHIFTKQAADGPQTLKELEAQDATERSEKPD